MERFADELDLTQVRIEELTQRTIAEIRRKLSDGVGRTDCQDCGATLPSERLRHVPNATRCAPCQNRHERRQSQFQFSASAAF
jgi:RNA polymerase-binding transcription factor DksA